MNTNFEFRFTIARFVPNQLRGEFVNVGMVLHVPETNQFYVKWLPNVERLRSLAPDMTLDQFKAVQDRLSDNYKLGSRYALINSPDTTIGDRVDVSSPDFLDYLHKEWSASFQFSEPVAGIIRDPKKHLERLYSQLVEPNFNSVKDTSRPTPLEKVRRGVEKALEKADLLGPEKIEKKIALPGLIKREQFDFGRVNGHVTVVETVSMAQISPDEKSNQAWVLTGKVDDIRQSGNFLTKYVEAYAVIQQSKDPLRLEGLEDAKKILEHKKITTVPENDIASLIKDLENSLKFKLYTLEV